MANVKFRSSRRTLTSHAGLSIIGQCLEVAGVDSIDNRLPTTLGMCTIDVAKSYLGLLCLGMSDYDAIDNFRHDKPFQQLLTLQKVPSAATLRQRLEKLAAKRFPETVANSTTSSSGTRGTRPRRIWIPSARRRPAIGKNCALASVKPYGRRASITVDKVEYVVKRVMRLVERTADRDRQLLL